MASTPANPTAKITNNLDYDVDIYDCFSDGEPNTVITYKLLASISSGKTASVLTEHAANQLQAMRSANISALNNDYYVQFPAAVMAVTNFTDNTFALEKTMAESMEQAFKFIKFIHANGDSKLAKGFRAALAADTKPKDAVNKFFAGSGSFKKCTYVSWIAVLTWQSQLMSAWKGTYYLYSVPASGEKSPRTALIAQLDITSSVEGSSAKLTMTDTSNDPVTLKMVGDGTMQEETQGDGGITAILTPSWINTSQNSTKDDKQAVKLVIGVAIAGKINDYKVAGNLNKLDLPKPTDTSKKAVTQQAAKCDWFSKLAQLAGVVSGLGMLYYMAKGHNEKATKAADQAETGATDAADAQARRSRSEAASEAVDAPLIRVEQQNAETNLVSHVRENYENVSQARQINSNVNELQRSQNDLVEVLQEGPASQLTQNSASSLQTAENALDHALDPATTAAQRQADVATANTEITTTATDIAKELAKGPALADSEMQALKSTEKAMKAETERNESAKDAETEQDLENNKEETEETNEDIFEGPEPEPMDMPLDPVVPP